MSRWRPCKRRLFIRRLKMLGFLGPYQGTRYQFMVHGSHRLTVPSNEEFSVPQLSRLIAEVEVILRREVTSAEWGRLQ